MPAPRQLDRPLLLVFLTAFLLTLWVQWPRLVNPYAVEEDFRRHHWLDGFSAGQLFEEDPAVGGFVFELATPLGTLALDRRSPLFGAIYQIGSHLLPIVLLSKLLTFPLALAGAYYTFRIAETKGRSTALTAALAFILLNLASNTMTSTLGGLQRSFTVPLCLALLYYLLQKRDWAAALVLIASGLIYAPLFVVGGLTYVFTLYSDRPAGRALDPRRLRPLLLAALVVAVMLAPLMLGRSDTSAVKTGGPLAFLDDPLLQPNGRHALFTAFPMIGHGGLMLPGVDVIHLIVFYVLLVAFWFVDRRAIVDLPAPLKHLFWATLIGFVLAWLTPLLAGSFLLYFPSRYTQTPLLLFGFLGVVLNAGSILAQAAGQLARQRGQLYKVVLPVALLGLALVLFLPAGGAGVGRGGGRWLLLALDLVLLALAGILWRRGPQPAAAAAPAAAGRAWPVGLSLGLPLFLLGLVYVNFIKWPFYAATTNEIALFDFLQTLPPDTLLAGAPPVLDSVPLFADRRVLFSREQIHPDPQVMYDAVDAYYAAAPAIIADFCRRYDIDYLIVNERDFRDAALQSGHYLWEPYDSYLAPRLQPVPPDLVLRDLAAGRKAFQAGSIYAVACAEFTASAP